MRRLALAIALMVLARRLLIGGSGGSFTPPRDLYALYNGQTGDGVYAIGAASKTPTGSWTRYVSNPVLQKGSGGTWDDDHVKDPWLIHDGTQFVTYYAGYDGANYRIGRAIASAYTGPWTKYGSNPVITLGSGGTFDDAGAIFPAVLYEPTDTGREWKMWYGAFDGSAYSIGYAYSSDGLSWTKFGQVLAVGSGWESAGCNVGAIIKSGSTYHLFYGGYAGGPSWQGGLATFTDPEGTYTRSGSNPVVEHRASDPGVPNLLTANLTSGTKIVTIADTSAYNDNEPVGFADTDSAGVNEIDTIDSGTQITLKANVTSTIAVADGGAFRPFAYNSVQPRSVRATATGYEMFATIFQPVSDLSTSGPTLWEGSIRLTAAGLEGPWSYDYTTGILFPLDPIVSGTWDDQSAENLSAIAAP